MKKLFSLLSLAMFSFSVPLSASVVQPNDTIYPLVGMSFYDYCPPYAAKRGDCEGDGYVVARDEIQDTVLLSQAIQNGASVGEETTYLGAYIKTCWTQVFRSWGEQTSCSIVMTQDVLLANGVARLAFDDGAVLGLDPVTGREFPVEVTQVDECLVVLRGDFTDAIYGTPRDISYTFDTCVNVQ